jgi:hypothetical protein
MCLFFINFRPTVWLSGSGVTSETPSRLSRHFWKSAAGRAAEPLSAGAGVGRFCFFMLIIHQKVSQFIQQSGFLPS